MKIKELSLTNFRRFEQLNLKLPDSNFIILIGENGCGKSSVLDAMKSEIEVVAAGLTGSANDYPFESQFHSNDVTNTGNKLELHLIVNVWNENVHIDSSYNAEKNMRKTDISSWFLMDVKKQKKAKTGYIKNLPVLVYYGLNRTYQIDDFKPPKKTEFLDEIFKGYKFAFNDKNSSFYEFENWFITQENIENEQKIIKKNLDFELVSLKIIRKVVEQFLTKMSAEEFANLRVRRASESNLQFSNPTNQGELIIQKNNKEVKIKQLSSGEKMILLLVCDIARRLLILNSMDENCLEGEGVVLIDEIEMHLHPKWQRRIVPALRKVFPNIQFIATTHSPQVLSNLSDNEIIVLDDNKYYSPASNPYGRDSNGILEEIFGTTERPAKADKLVDEIFDILSNGQHDIPKAETKLNELRGHLGAQDPILLRIENLINRKKILTQ